MRTSSKPKKEAKRSQSWYAELFGISPQDARARIQTLTRRQGEAAQKVAQGKTNAAIAEEMGISKKTLDIHRFNICDKLKTHTAGIPRIWFAAQFAEEE